MFHDDFSSYCPRVRWFLAIQLSMISPLALGLTYCGRNPASPWMVRTQQWDVYHLFYSSGAGFCNQPPYGTLVGGFTPEFYFHIWDNPSHFCFSRWLITNPLVI